MESQSNNPSLIIGNCLNCKGLVRVPINAPSDSTVRCPHCSESFQLVKMLADAIPEMEVVTEEPEEVIPRVDQIITPKSPEEVERQKFVVPSQLSKGARGRRSRRSRSSQRAVENRESVGSFSSMDFDSDEDKDSDSGFAQHDSRSDEGPVISESLSFGSSNEVERRPSRSRHSSRRSSRGKGKVKGPNPAVELVKVVLGGLLAIPIAYLLVLSLFRQDPLGFAPTVEKVAPFLVPKNLKTKEEEADGPEIDEEISTSTEDEDRVIDLEKEPLPFSALESGGLGLEVDK